MTDSPIAPSTGILGFLTVLKESGGYVGGYLLTNSWGRPMEFRLSSAVQPTRVQTILYGPTLDSFLQGELIGKTLVEKTTIPPGLIITDTPETISLRSHVAVPMICLTLSPNPDDVILDFKSSSLPIILPAKFATDRELVLARLSILDTGLDLAEPFVRLREAIAEARKVGGARAA